MGREERREKLKNNGIYTLEGAVLTEEQPFAYWLHRVEGIGNAGKEELLAKFGTPGEIYRAGAESLKAVMKPEQAERLLQARKEEVFASYDELVEKGISFYPFYHPEYPERLKEIGDRPFGLYVKGHLPQNDTKRVAIIGARNCSAYGKYVAEQFAEGLAEKEVEIVSGMAMGIDSLAQAAALRVGGATYAVLGCGVDICYPSAHKALYEEICGKGGVLSEYPPGTTPIPERFPPRNRIISGLSDAILVVEARQKSGTLITVDMALEQGREVYVVPGRITDRLSDGCNRLLEQGAAIALSPKQLYRELVETVWNGQSTGGVTEKKECSKVEHEGDRQRKACKREEAGNESLTRKRRKSIDGKERDAGSQQADALRELSSQEKELLSMLDFYPVSLDQIRIMMQTNKNLCSLTLPQTMELLVRLTIKGLVKNTGGHYELCKPV